MIRFTLVSITLLIAVPGMAMGKKPARHPGKPVTATPGAPVKTQAGEVVSVLEATESGSELQVSLRNSKGENVVLTSKELGCQHVTYGTNMASCLKSCDGKTSVLLASEPAYDEVVANIEHSAYTGVRSVVAHGGDVEAKQTATGITQLSNLKGTTNAELCDPSFDGDRCLNEMSLTLASGDPLEQYQVALESSGNAVAESLATNVSEMRSLMNSKGIIGYLRQGNFVSHNLRTAPLLLCQLKSRLPVNVGSVPTAALDVALAADAAELDHSLDFLRRYDPSFRF